MVWSGDTAGPQVEPADENSVMVVLALLRGEPVPLSEAGPGRPPRLLGSKPQVRTLPGRPPQTLGRLKPFVAVFLARFGLPNC